VGPILDAVVGFFIDRPGRTMALGSIHPLTNEYQGHLGGRGPVRRADNLTT
jgi:hypothetical protein